MTNHGTQADQYLILVEGGHPTNYSAWSPDLPGCVATGATIDECEAEMKDAIAFHLEGWRRTANRNRMELARACTSLGLRGPPSDAYWVAFSATKTTCRRRATSGSVSSGTRSAPSANRADERR